VPEVAFQRCISPDCGETYALDDARVACSRCGFSGVWRFHELLPFAPPEQSSPSAKGRRCCSRPTAWRPYVGMKPGRLFLQYEG
jgi:threonine synthase